MWYIDWNQINHLESALYNIIKKSCKNIISEKSIFLMQGFKNLLPRQLLNDDSVQPVVKKTDEHRKITQSCL